MALIRCPDCKRQVSDQAPACPRCGRPMQATRTVDDPQRWEMCRIAWEPKMFMGHPTWPWKFWADAVHPARGSYSAGESRAFKPGKLIQFVEGTEWEKSPPSGGDKDTVEAFEELRNKLVRDGWEPTGQVGHPWWMWQFRRPVQAEQQLGRRDDDFESEYEFHEEHETEEHEIYDEHDGKRKDWEYQDVTIRFERKLKHVEEPSESDEDRLEQAVLGDVENMLADGWKFTHATDWQFLLRQDRVRYHYEVGLLGSARDRVESVSVRLGRPLYPNR